MTTFRIFMQFKVVIALSLFISSSLALADDSDNRLISLSRFENGDFSIAVTEKIEVDPAIDEKVITFFEMLNTQDQVFALASKSLEEGVPENHVSSKFWKELEFASFRLHSELCRQTEGYESQLTALLLMGASALDWPKGASTPIYNALETIQNEYPRQWQSQVAPLVMAQLLVQKSDPKQYAKKALEATNLLRRTLPSPEYVLDTDNKHVEAFRGRYKLTPPLRAAFLVSLFTIEYNAGTSSANPTSIKKSLDNAEETGRQLMKEYPDTPHAQWMKTMVEQQIPAMREALLPQ